MGSRRSNPNPAVSRLWVWSLAAVLAVELIVRREHRVAVRGAGRGAAGGGRGRADINGGRGVAARAAGARLSVMVGLACRRCAAVPVAVAVPPGGVAELLGPSAAAGDIGRRGRTEAAVGGAVVMRGCAVGRRGVPPPPGDVMVGLAGGRAGRGRAAGRRR